MRARWAFVRLCAITMAMCLASGSCAVVLRRRRHTSIGSHHGPQWWPSIVLAHYAAHRRVPLQPMHTHRHLMAPTQICHMCVFQCVTKPEKTFMNSVRQYVALAAMKLGRVHAQCGIPNMYVRRHMRGKNKGRKDAPAVAFPKRNCRHLFRSFLPVRYGVKRHRHF